MKGEKDRKKRGWAGGHISFSVLRGFLGHNLKADFVIEEKPVEDQKSPGIDGKKGTFLGGREEGDSVIWRRNPGGKPREKEVRLRSSSTRKEPS